MRRKNNAPAHKEGLDWPVGRPRTNPDKRQKAQFRENGSLVTVEQACVRLRQIMHRMKVTNPIITFEPTYYGGEPKDTGVAVYFTRNGHPHCMPCDKWNRVADNMAAIASHLLAIHGMTRWGVGDMDQAFAGYKALPAMGEVKPWWNTLGFKVPPVDITEAKGHYLERITKAHPDLGGNATQAAEINAAMHEAETYYQKVA